MRWAKPASGPQRGQVPTRIAQVLEVGDVIYVDPIDGREGQFRLRQVPEVSGAIVALDPHTGRVFAMVGGFSFDQSQFNRATQALRQPGSSFKPLVYAAALDNGYTPSTVVLDAPLEIDTGSGVWRPENYEGKFYGPSTLRFGIERSRNVMTVRLAQDLGMPMIGEYAKRFGIYDNPPPYISFVLGAGETTLLRMTAAYAMFDNGGRKITPTLIDRIQDRYGRTIYRHDQRECQRLQLRGVVEQPDRADAGRPARARARSDDRLPDHLDDGRRGAARHRRPSSASSASRSPARPAPPTTRRTPGSSASRRKWWSASMSATTSRATSAAAAPAASWRRRSCSDFLKVALADRPAVPFRVPAGIKLIRVNPRTGMRAGPGEASILEAFKPGTAPPDGYSVVGVTDPDGRPVAAPQQRSAAAATAAAAYLPGPVRRPRALLRS